MSSDDKQPTIPNFSFPNRKDVPLTYVNFLNIVHSDGEFFLEFGLADIPIIQDCLRSGSNSITVDVKTRLAIPSHYFENMVQMIQMNHMQFMKEQTDKYSEKVNTLRAAKEKAQEFAGKAKTDEPEQQ